MTSDTITIFVTVYNIAPYLDRFFENLRRQTVRDYEVLIVDDGSTDNSLEICRRHAANDPRIRVLTTRHIGISAARNMAFKYIFTDLVTSLDGDDYFDENYLKHLLDAHRKYNADLVISNVIYRYENDEEFDRFSPRKEELIEKARFGEELPKLLTERRLNYLYAKLYRLKYLKTLHVQEDVMQGSDTMLNSQYVTKINSIAVIEYYDYNYIKYTKRSVTSYNGDHVFKRLYRINNYVYKIMEEAGMLNGAMLHAIDGRILHSGLLALRNIAKLNEPLHQKMHKAEQIIRSEEYGRSYRRQAKLGKLGEYHFTVIEPGKEREYVRDLCQKIRFNKRYESVKSNMPDWILKTWHKIKK